MPDFKYNFLNIEGENLKVGIYSTVFENCPSDYVDYQWRVFEKFNTKINQCLHTKPCPSVGIPRHGDFLDQISRSEDVDYLVFFDVDAIPLKENFLEILINRVHGRKAILGIEQKSNHINVDKKECYAGPACFVISKETYKHLGEPSYNETYRSDCGEELSWVAREKGVEVKYIEFTKCQEPMWDLKDGVKFGVGSEYEGLVFHNFQARMLGADSFKKKCNEILEANEKKSLSIIENGKK